MSAARFALPLPEELLRDRPNIAAAITDAASVPVEEIPALLTEVTADMARLMAVQTILAARFAAGQRKRAEARTADAEWLSVGDLTAWLGYSDRTIRRYMRDGTWREGQHWFRHKGRLRFRRSALEAWLPAQDKEPPAVGLAYGLDIPRGRRRRLKDVAQQSRNSPYGATAGADEDGEAGRVPGAKAAHGAA